MKSNQFNSHHCQNSASCLNNDVMVTKKKDLAGCGDIYKKSCHLVSETAHVQANRKQCSYDCHCDVTSCPVYIHLLNQNDIGVCDIIFS